MAARDQALFLETYLGLKRALKRKSYDSDSDSSIDQSTNRGNKLKRRARFVREGQLGAADGLSVFAEVTDYAGYRREIISHNPPLVDEDGYEVDSDEDDEVIQEAEATAADQNPYAGIRLEHILAPLTAVTDLPTHPTLSRPFTSKALSELATQGCNWMHKENAALWEVKPLLAKFCGDHIWVDCELMVTPDDGDLFDDTFVARLAAAAAGEGVIESGAEQKQINGGGSDSSSSEKQNGEVDQEAGGSAEKDTDMPDAVAGGGDAQAPNGDEKPNAGDDTAEAVEATPNGDAETAKKGKQKDNGIGATDAKKEEAVLVANGTTTAAAATSGALVLASAEVDDDEAENDDDDDGSSGFIHPLFLAPRSAHPEPNLGLPEAEAEDVRRLLQLWVQKQEEVARGTKKLHEGLLRADRLRKTVFTWSKAEAHSGPNRDLSDGEDWYDREEWGLAEDLKKGHDEEEEDTQVQHKKTRNRK